VSRISFDLAYFYAVLFAVSIFCFSFFAHLVVYAHFRVYILTVCPYECAALCSGRFKGRTRGRGLPPLLSALIFFSIRSLFAHKRHNSPLCAFDIIDNRADTLSSTLPPSKFLDPPLALCVIKNDHGRIQEFAKGGRSVPFPASLLLLPFPSPQK